MLAGLKRGDGGFGVLVPHGDDRDGIDVGIGQHVAIVAEGLFDAELLRRVAFSRSGVRVHSAASSRLGTPRMASQWISPNHPSPMTPIRSLSIARLLRNSRG